MTQLPTKIWIETKAETALALAKIARLMDGEVVGPTQMAKIIMDSLDVLLTGIERIDALTAEEPVVSRSPIFQYFDRERITDAIEVLQNLWIEVGQSCWISTQDNSSGGTYADIQKGT